MAAVSPPRGEFGAAFRTHFLSSLRTKQAELRHHSRTVNQYQNMLSKFKQQTTQIEKLKQENAALQRRLEDADTLGASMAGMPASAASNRASQKVDQRVLQLTAKNEKLNEEIQEAMRGKATYQQSIIDLQRESASLRDRVQTLQSQTVTTGDELKDSKTKLVEMEARTKEAEMQYRIVREENAAREALIASALDARRKAEEDNTMLMERFIVEKTSCAQSINEMTLLNGQQASKIRQLEEKLRMAETGGMSKMDEELSKIKRMGIDAIVSTKIPKKTYRVMEDAHAGEINCISFDSVGGSFLTCSNDKTVKLWDTATQASTLTFHGPTASVMRCGFAGEGDRIYGSGNDKACYIWNRGGRLQHTLTGHTGEIWGAGVTGDGKMVVTGSRDRTIRFWDLGANGRCVRALPSESSVHDLIMLSGHDMAATGHFDSHIRFWDMRMSEVADEIEDAHEGGPITGLAQVPSGYTLLSYGRDSSVRTFDIRTLKQLCFFKHEDCQNMLNYSRPACSPDGKYVAAGGGGKTSRPQVFVWTADKGRCVSVLPGANKSCISGVEWSTDARFLVAVGLDRSISFFEPE